MSQSLSELEKQIAANELKSKRLRNQANEQARKDYLDGLEATKREREKPMRERLRKEAKARMEAFKAEKLSVYLEHGGTEAEFEKEWPDIRREWLKNLTLESNENATKARVRQSGRYDL